MNNGIDAGEIITRIVMRKHEKHSLLFCRESIILFDAHKWYLSDSDGKLYLKRKTPENKWIYFHRTLLQARRGSVIDRKNGDTLDYRKSNLRVATNSENLCNQRKLRITNSSGYTEVYKDRGRWSAVIWKDYKRYHLGSFANKENAREARNKAAEILHGEFAVLDAK